MSDQVRPFAIEVSDAHLQDLSRRLAASRWPAPSSGPDDWSRGVPADYLRELASYWASGFSWRDQEARFNSLGQYTTDVEGQTIHFVHVRSSNPDAIPLLLTHGWPSAFVEFLDVIDPLTNPERHGGKSADAFHLVIPSLPGFGFSSPLVPGWGNLFRVAGAWAEVMRRLGYRRYVAHGGDIGGGVTSMLPMVDPDGVAAIHLTGPSPFPFGPPIDGSKLSSRDAARAARFNAFREDGTGYLRLQSTRPQTLGYALGDSPIGQLAWIVEKFAEWTDPAKPLPHDAVDRDLLLAIVSIFWFTGGGASSAHFTYEGMKAFAEMSRSAGRRPQGMFSPAGPPTGVSVFAADFSIRSILDPDGAVASWTEYDRGGHFPAMETPDLLVGELRRFFGAHRPART